MEKYGRNYVRNNKKSERTLTCLLLRENKYGTNNRLINLLQIDNSFSLYFLTFTVLEHIRGFSVGGLRNALMLI